MTATTAIATAEDDRPLVVPSRGRRRDTVDDASIVSMLGRCAAGEVDALSDLYDATAALVFRLSLMVLGDEDRAASNTNRTYRAVWEYSARYDRSREGSALSWVVTLAYAQARSATDKDRQWRADVEPDSGPRVARVGDRPLRGTCGGTVGCHDREGLDSGDAPRPE